MGTAWTAVLLLGIIGAVCSPDGPENSTQPPGSPLPETRRERLERLDPDVYSEIRSITDCSDLETAFERAATTNEQYEIGHPMHGYTLGAMRAAEEQIDALGCEG